MEYLHVLLLAVVQGVSEFLPISSDGHLVLTDALWRALGGSPLSDLLMVEIVLHGGTLAAILVVYWKRVWSLLGSDRRVLARLIVGTLPAVAIGLPLHEIESLHGVLESPLLAAYMLPVTGALLLTIRGRNEGRIAYEEISFRDAFLIGLAQSVAILPGVSRSGMTIVAALALGLRREAAATFSFMLAIPAVGGAVVLALLKLVREPTSDINLGPLVVGTAVSFVVGVIALRLLLKVLSDGRLYLFAYWCFLVGAIAIAWFLVAGTPAEGNENSQAAAVTVSQTSGA